MKPACYAIMRVHKEQYSKSLQRQGADERAERVQHWRLKTEHNGIRHFVV